jgi:hypothetical protein
LYKVHKPHWESQLKIQAIFRAVIIIIFCPKKKLKMRRKADQFCFVGEGVEVDRNHRIPKGDFAEMLKQFFLEQSKKQSKLDDDHVTCVLFRIAWRC